MRPTISVIIPCYNGAQFLRDAIDAVLRQTYPAHELIVVDDGSSDNSSEIASSFGSRVRLVRQPNKGEGGARNAGAAVATGSHLFFLDADDLIAPDALKALAGAAIDDPGAMVLMRSVAFGEQPDRPPSEPSDPPHSFFPDLISTCIGVPHTWLTPRHVYQRTTGFVETRNYFVDWEFWCQAALLNPTLIVVPFVGALYRRHAQTMSANTPRMTRARGHVAVLQTLSAGFLTQADLLNEHGSDLFWSCWTALYRGRKAGMPWAELAPLCSAIEDITRRGPRSVRTSIVARAVRWLGVRQAYLLRNGLAA